MSKFDTLYKKIELFEKLAIYSDRGAFLKALAQQGSDPKVLELVKQMESLIRGAGITDESILAPFVNVSIFNNAPDVGAIIRASSKARLQMTGLANGNEINQLIRLEQQLRVAGTTPDPGANEPPMVFTPDPVKDQIKAYPPIDAKQQSALCRIVTIKGLTFVDPNKMSDGKLGPETRKALNAFKKYLTKKSPNKRSISDQEALNIAENMDQNKAYA